MINRKAIIQQLKEEELELEALILETERRYKDAPKGSIRIMKHGNGNQFFHRKDPKDRKGEYIPASDRNRVYALIQKKYDEKILEAARKQLNCIRQFIVSYDLNRLQNVYRFTREERKQFISPVELPDEDFVHRWQEVSYEGKGFSENVPEHYTEKGERVRSKSEVIIADALNHAGIPYRYECPLRLGNHIIHPDFTVLRLSDRKEVYWEHLGMMDDASYRNDAFSRICLYERNGIFPGDRLIISAETYRQPLNLNNISRMIQHYFS